MPDKHQQTQRETRVVERYAVTCDEKHVYLDMDFRLPNGRKEVPRRFQLDEEQACEIKEGLGQARV